MLQYSKSTNQSCGDEYTGKDESGGCHGEDGLAARRVPADGGHWKGLPTYSPIDMLEWLSSHG